ncbi:MULTISPECIES: gluconokinase [unclassified Chromobacterium]|uniref:gluconokinase n=1 Tax=unclassified Chromobacterium TaxID=2641838 RepID=UPI000652E327|nr:gluconokinase [Chromobacterium sp. LK1]KMN33460.1 gluconate kinase [Chromobacterium sp. LK1]
MSSIPHRVYVLMGVSGCGKSALAARLAHCLPCAVLDGDFLHPRANIDKMAAGVPLDDADRHPWLAALSDAAYAMQRSNPLSIIVCSALKRQYRDQLRAGNPQLSFLYLKGDFELILQRLRTRQGHFQKADMLASQFAALEEPGSDEGDVHALDISRPLDEVAASAVQWIQSRQDN